MLLVIFQGLLQMPSISWLLQLITSQWK